MYEIDCDIFMYKDSRWLLGFCCIEDQRVPFYTGRMRGDKSKLNFRNVLVSKLTLGNEKEGFCAFWWKFCSFSILCFLLCYVDWIVVVMSGVCLFVVGVKAFESTKWTFAEKRSWVAVTFNWDVAQSVDNLSLAEWKLLHRVRLYTILSYLLVQQWDDDHTNVQHQRV